MAAIGEPVIEIGKAQGEEETLIKGDADLVSGRELVLENPALARDDGFAEQLKAGQNRVQRLRHGREFLRIDEIEAVLATKVESSPIVLRDGSREESGPLDAVIFPEDAKFVLHRVETGDSGAGRYPEEIVLILDEGGDVIVGQSVDVGIEIRDFPGGGVETIESGIERADPDDAVGVGQDPTDALACERFGAGKDGLEGPQGIAPSREEIGA